MPKRVDKPWGHEEIWAETVDYVGKVLFIKQGHRLSLQHHVIKEETIRIASGIMELELQSESGDMETHTLHPGDSRHIAPGRRHRMYAVTDVQVYEVSTPHLSDVVRHQDDYGRS